LTLKEFYEKPFEWMDKRIVVFKGNNLNIFQKYVRLRKVAFSTAIFCFGCWLIFGFDSTPLQFMHVLFELPSFFVGQITLEGLVQIYHEFYGKEMHYSAFVIYGLMYWALSRHFHENLKIEGSKNVVFTCGIVFFSVALFEYYWIYSFAIFQNQSWVGTWKMPQLRILAQNLMFAVAGIGVISYIYLDSFITKGKKILRKQWKFNLNLLSLSLIVLSIASMIFWQNYPWYVEKISVPLDNGEIWSNTNCFPQTLYTIDLNPDDNFNAGTWFFVENDVIHATNTLIKILVTYTIFYIAKLRKVEP